MTNRDPKTGRFVRADDPEEIPPFDRHDAPIPTPWTPRDTVWAIIGLGGLIVAFLAALIL